MNRKENRKENLRQFLKCFLGICVFPGLFFLTARGEPVQQGTDWYYLKEDRGAVRNEFVAIDGELYYFGSDGKLLRESILEYGQDLYYCDGSGKILKNGWKYCDCSDSGRSGWRYFLSTGRAFQNGWLTIGEKRRHFTDSRMDWGWYTEDTGGGKSAVYYLGTEADGCMRTGWLAWKGEDVPGGEERPSGWYYFRPGSGKMAADTELSIGQDTYAFNSSGVMTAGFCTVTDGKGTQEKYYDVKTGKRAEGWTWLEEGQGEREEGWYYFTEGVPFRPETCTRKLCESAGVSKIDGTWYCFDAAGKMLTGLLKTGGNRYYCFDGDGKLMCGYVKVPSGGQEPPAEYMLFSPECSAPPALGCSVTGEYGGSVYSGGVKLAAEEDRYEKVSYETDSGTVTCIVSEQGQLIRSGTVVLKDGSRKRVYRSNGSWDWEDLN